MRNMTDSIYLLDFRRGRVEAIDDSLPPRGVREVESPLEVYEPVPTAGFELAALGTPPEPDEDS
jgi:hypothetical protein